jgi:sugar phosphate isomerase/epimerase
MICVENIDYDFGLIAGLVETFDLAVCVDIGHLLLTHRDVQAHLDRWLDRTRIIHLHGVRDGNHDHVAISHLPEGMLESLAARLAQTPTDVQRVVTLEIFGEDDFLRSMDVIEERLAPWLKSR